MAKANLTAVPEGRKGRGMSARKESTADYAKRLADERHAERLETYSKHGWDPRRIRAWREGDLWFHREPAFTIVIGSRDDLIARHLCSSHDFPEGRRRISWGRQDSSSSSWKLKKNARDVCELFVSACGASFCDAESAFHDHLHDVARRERDYVRRVDPGCFRAFERFMRACIGNSALSEGGMS